jgi:hypothetical protein
MIVPPPVMSGETRGAGGSVKPHRGDIASVFA